MLGAMGKAKIRLLELEGLQHGLVGNAAQRQDQRMLGHAFQLGCR